MILFQLMYQFHNDQGTFHHCESHNHNSHHHSHHCTTCVLFSFDPLLPAPSRLSFSFANNKPIKSINQLYHNDNPQKTAYANSIQFLLVGKSLINSLKKWIAFQFFLLIGINYSSVIAPTIFFLALGNSSLAMFGIRQSCWTDLFWP